MEDDSASYIRMVHHLIEECIVFKMSMEECMEALSKHANIKPIITSTVWKELEKENKEFFEAYGKSREDQIVKMRNEVYEVERREGIQRVLSASASDAASKTHDHTHY